MEWLAAVKIGDREREIDRERESASEHALGERLLNSYQNVKILPLNTLRRERIPLVTFPVCPF